MEDDPLLEHVSRHLAETLVRSKELKLRENGMILKIAELRKSDQETKKLLFEKSQETLRIYARNLIFG